MLIVQVCILISLLRRLAEVHRAGSLQPDMTAPIAPAQAAGLAVASGAAQGRPLPDAGLQMPAPVPDAQHLRGPAVASAARPQSQASVAASSAGGRKSKGLSLGVACGVGQDAVLLHVASLIRNSDSHVVLFVESPAMRSLLDQEGIASARVTLEAVSLPLAQPWEHCHLDSARFRLYKNYFERTGAAGQYDYVQLSHVEDVVFQGDPFAWVAGQPTGLHFFGDEPSHTVSKDTGLKQVLQQAFGQDTVARLQSEVVLPAGYIIGNADAVQRYVDAVATEVQKAPVCQKKGSDQVVHEVLARRWLQEASSGNPAHVHEWGNSPVWTGGHIARGAVTMDQEKRVVNKQYQPYLVLHQYDEHDDLWRVLANRILKNRMQQRSDAKQKEHCQGYEVAAGDMRGYDVSHTPADGEEDCCAACSKETACSSFIFSASRKHCWLKKKGGLRIPPHQGEDLLLGARKT